MDTAYLKLVSGTRLSNYMGLEMLEGHPYKYTPSYLAIDVPLRGFRTADSPVLVDEVKRNQHVFVVPACTVNVRGSYIVEVEPNPELAEFGQVQAGYKIHPGQGRKEPGFWFTARKDVTKDMFPVAIKLYMIT